MLPSNSQALRSAPRQHIGQDLARAEVENISRATDQANRAAVRAGTGREGTDKQHKYNFGQFLEQPANEQEREKLGQ